MAQKNQIVLIAGKGHEDYQVFKDHTIAFNEREIVKEFYNHRNHRSHQGDVSARAGQAR